MAAGRARRWRAPLRPGLCLLLVASACGSPAPGPATTPGPATAVVTPGATCAERVFAAMDPARRVGQLFLVGLAGDRLDTVSADAIRTDHFGSVWFTESTPASLATVRSVTDAVQAQATLPSTAGVRFFVAANQEGGEVQALVGRGFSQIPSARAQGGLDPGTLRRDAAAWGRELRQAGVNLDFAPVTDVVPPGQDAANRPIGALQRGYGHDPATVGAHASAFLLGMEDAGVATTLKHFPGLGRVQGNTDFTASVTDTSTAADDASVRSFRAGIDAGAPFVMVALARYTRIDGDHLAAFSATVMGQLLRGTLGFTGVVMSDDLGATAAVAAIDPGRRAVDFLAAGGDLVVSKTAEASLPMAAAVRERSTRDAAFRGRVDDAVLRVLRAKQAAGLLPCGDR